MFSAVFVLQIFQYCFFFGKGFTVKVVLVHQFLGLLFPLAVIFIQFGIVHFLHSDILQTAREGVLDLSEIGSLEFTKQ